VTANDSLDSPAGEWLKVSLGIVLGLALAVGPFLLLPFVLAIAFVLASAFGLHALAWIHIGLFLVLALVFSFSRKDTVAKGILMVATLVTLLYAQAWYADMIAHQAMQATGLNP
jgi:hypothetical protein